MFHTLVLSGGSFKGISYIGVFQKLEETGIRPNIQTVSACSVGSIFGLLWILGLSASEMRQIIQKYNFAKIYQFNLNTLLDGFGCSDFSRIIEILSDILASKQLSPSLTFQQLYDYSKVHFLVNSVCLETESANYFHYLVSPEMPVLLAVQMSCAIPLLFPRVVYQNQTYIDGGIIDHLPFRCLTTETDKHLCISLSEDFDRPNLTSFSGYLMAVIKLMTKRLNLVDHAIRPPSHFILKINVPINLLDILVDSQQITSLIETGYQQASYYLALWKVKYHLILPSDQPKKILIKLKFK